jgi:hypothetical protein
MARRNHSNCVGSKIERLFGHDETFCSEDGVSRVGSSACDVPASELSKNGGKLFKKQTVHDLSTQVVSSR